MTSNPDGCSFFQNLPDEVIVHIYGFLDQTSRLWLSPTDRQHRRILQKLTLQINDSHYERVVAPLERYLDEDNQNFLSKFQTISMTFLYQNDIFAISHLLSRYKFKKWFVNPVQGLDGALATYSGTGVGFE